ncbi:hypothetical protein SDC9_203501 [bioreactor metagenome]|uniref:Uncharacterized protein n=1 Tax=bioreactor metagenome TaxID=1076179 RepID=A0A645IXF2_9ZZZZ
MSATLRNLYIFSSPEISGDHNFIVVHVGRGIRFLDPGIHPTLGSIEGNSVTFVGRIGCQ